MESIKRERIQLDSTKSLRPKEFHRKTLLGSLQQNDSDRFFENTLQTLQSGTFSDIHLKCQLEDFERHRYATEKRNLEKEAELEKQHLLERSVLRQTMINKHKSLMAENTRKTLEMAERWKETQKVKKNRQIRDLQFELALTQMEELQRLKQKQIHERQEKDGIVQFERNMKKLGITSNESNGGMSISYETTEAYESRIKQLANQTMPTSEEVNNFKEQLKERTAANRLARYEKARRRRRALVQGDKEGNEDVAGTVNETEA